MTTINAGARLDRLPISAFHYRMLALIGAGMFIDGFEINLQGAVLGTLVSTGWSTPALNANFISVGFAGMVIGAWGAGVLGDRFGRRFSYQINLLIFTIGSLLGALAPSMGWLIAARFVMGIGLAAEVVVGYATMSELVPPASRGRWGAALAVCTTSSLFICSVVGRLVIPSLGWRWMFVIVAVAALLVWVMRKRMPESPRWLEARGDLAEAERVLSAIEAEVGRVHTLPPPIVIEAPARLRSSIASLFSRDMVMRTVVGSITLIALNTAIHAFIAFLPTLMVRQGINIVTSLNYTMVMSFGSPVGALLGMWLSDRIGRKPCIIGFSAAAVVFGSIYPHVGTPGLLMLTGFLLIASIYVLVANSWALYVPELFPTEIRMRGAGFCNTIGRLTTVVTPQLVAPLFLMAGVGGVIGAVTVVLAFQGVMVAVFGVETRGKSLEALGGDNAESPSARAITASAVIATADSSC